MPHISTQQSFLAVEVTVTGYTRRQKSRNVLILAPTHKLTLDPRGNLRHRRGTNQAFSFRSAYSPSVNNAPPHPQHASKRANWCEGHRQHLSHSTPSMHLHAGQDPTEAEQGDPACSEIRYLTCVHHLQTEKVGHMALYLAMIATLRVSKDRRKDKCTLCIYSSPHTLAASDCLESTVGAIYLSRPGHKGFSLPWSAPEPDGWMGGRPQDQSITRSKSKSPSRRESR